MGGHPVIVPPQAPARGAAWQRTVEAWGFSRRVRRRLAILLGVLVVVTAGMLVHPAYVIFRPGPVYDTLGSLGDKPVIEVKNAQTYDVSGDLFFTTVAVFGGPEHEINLWDYLWAKAQPGADIRPLDEVYPPTVTRAQIQEQTTVQMNDAQAEAKAVALRAAGKTVPERISIAGVMQNGPADGALRQDDRLVSLNGAPIDGVVGLRRGIQAAKDGEKLAFVVRRDGADVPVAVSTTVSEGRRVIGVGLKVDFDYPVDVEIHAGSIGGPSAGLMFSLGLYDRITPGPLTGGAKIAGTGTIADDGTVGPIGGIQHKLAGARDGDKADWFLAPIANCPDVRDHIPDGLHVVTVRTFDQAKHAVEEIAAGRGGALAGC